MKKKLTELANDVLKHLPWGQVSSHTAEELADYFIANGVTFRQWIPVSERMPEPFVSVLVQMPDEEPCPTVREGYLTNKGTWYAGYFERETSEVTHWMPLPEPPKEGE